MEFLDYDIECMKIRYAWSSTKEQNLLVQLAVLMREGGTMLYSEKLSVKHSDRPELKKMIDHIYLGDKVVVGKIDRLPCSITTLLEMTESFARSGVKFKSISKSWADAIALGGKVIMTFFAGVAEFGRELLRERTGTGPLGVLKRGAKFGRSVARTEEQEKKVAFELRRDDHSMKETRLLSGIMRRQFVGWGSARHE